MSYSEGKITGNVSVSDVRSVLGEASTDVGTLCKSAKINWRAKYKPMNRSVLGMLTEAQRAANPNPYGVVKANTALLTDIIEGIFPAWGCDLPTGGLASPYRLTDFRSEDPLLGYNHSAIAPLKVEWPLDLSFDASSTSDSRAFVLLGGYAVPGWEFGTCLGLTDLFPDIEDPNSETKYYFSIIMRGVVNGANRWWAVSSDRINTTAAAGNGEHRWTVLAFLNPSSSSSFPFTSGTDVKCVACLTTQTWGSGADPNLGSYAYPLSLNGSEEAIRTFTYTRESGQSYITVTVALKFTYSGVVDGDYIVYQVTNVSANVSAVDNSHNWNPDAISVDIRLSGNLIRSGATLQLGSSYRNTWQSLGSSADFDATNRYITLPKASTHGFGVQISKDGEFITGAGYSATGGVSGNVSGTATGEAVTVKINKPAV